jgi:flagellar motility protein MotE (MotC chaperone)
MSTFALTPSDTAAETAAADDFSILEQRVVRAVELLKNEREARATAEGTATTLQQLLDEQSQQLADTEARLKALESEREHVRGRVERMMKQLDEIG